MARKSILRLVTINAYNHAKLQENILRKAQEEANEDSQESGCGRSMDQL
jgi:hypothetical protein